MGTWLLVVVVSGSQLMALLCVPLYMYMAANLCNLRRARYSRVCWLGFGGGGELNLVACCHKEHVSVFLYWIGEYYW